MDEGAGPGGAQNCDPTQLKSAERRSDPCKPSSVLFHIEIAVKDSVLNIPTRKHMFRNCARSQFEAQAKNNAGFIFTFHRFPPRRTRKQG